MWSLVVVVALALGSGLAAQESTPVPKDSLRVFVPGCSKGYVFTAAPRMVDQPGATGLPEGTHLRMNGPKKLINDIKAREGSMIEITGLIRRSDLTSEGLSLGRVRISPGGRPGSGNAIPTPASRQMVIDVEGWRNIPGDCPR